MSDRHRFERLGRLGLAAMIALVVFAGGLEIAGHGRLPRADVRGTAIVQIALGDDVASCAICGLAHQASSVPCLTLGVGNPSGPSHAAVSHPPARTSTGIRLAGSPRAPPCPASC
jgi:hypothetical protein